MSTPIHRGSNKTEIDGEVVRKLLLREIAEAVGIPAGEIALTISAATEKAWCQLQRKVLQAVQK